MSEYQPGPRNLSPNGEMRLLRYNPETGLHDTVKTIGNPEIKLVKPKPTGLIQKLSRFFSIDWSMNFEMSEIEWTKVAIAEARKLGCSRVDYIHEPFDLIRHITIWDLHNER